MVALIFVKDVVSFKLSKKRIQKHVKIIHIYHES